jgi:rhodanese-related sulfurtransferase
MQYGPAGWMNDVLRANAACTRDPRCVAVPTEGHTCEAVPAAPGVERISIDDLRRELDTVVVVDVREPAELTGALGHIRGAINVPLAELPARLDELEPLQRRRLVATCKAGARSSTAAVLLRGRGFDVRVLDGGMTAWNERGLPVERGP